MQTRPETIGKRVLKTPPIPANSHTQPIETKRQKFERLAVARVKKILKSIDIMKNIGRNRSSYDFTNADVEKIIIALRRKVDELEIAMINTKTDEPGFEL